MKIIVKPTNYFCDGVMLKKGVNFIDEELTPKLASKIQDALSKGDKDLELYGGDEDGHDPKGSRKKRDELEAEAKVRKKSEKK